MPAYAQEADCPYIFESAAPACNDGNALNGYWWFGAWVPGLPTMESWFRLGPIWSYGNAVWYDPGIMEATIRARGLSLGNAIDGVALPVCAHIGHKVWLRRPDHDWEGPYLVADCAQQNDIYGVVVHRGEVVEVGWKTAVRWGLDEVWRMEGIEVLRINPNKADLSGRATHYPSWWEATVEFAEGWPDHPIYQPPSSWRIQGEWVTFLEPLVPEIKPTPTVTSTPTFIPTATPTATPTQLPPPIISATLEKQEDMMFEEMLNAIWTQYGGVITTLLVLIAADLVLGILAAVKAGEFKWKEIGRFYQTKVVPLLGGYVVVVVVVRFADPEAMGDFIETVGPGLEAAARVLAIGTLVASVVGHLQFLGIIPGLVNGALEKVGLPPPKPENYGPGAG